MAGTVAISAAAPVLAAAGSPAIAAQAQTRPPPKAKAAAANFPITRPLERYWVEAGMCQTVLRKAMIFCAKSAIIYA